MGEQKRKGKSGVSRRRRSKPAVTMAIVIICVIGIGVADFISRSKNSPLRQFDPARSKGSQAAPIHIFEFVDFQCSQCAKGSKFIQAFMSQHPDSVFLTVKYYPLGELNSMISAHYGECAARQGKFWPMHDRLFELQARWRTLRKPRPFLDSIAGDIPLNMNELELCLDQGSVHSIVSGERMLGESYFVKSTPTYFINDQIVVGVEEMSKTLEAFFDN